MAAAELDTAGMRSRALQLKGRNEPVEVWALRALPDAPAGYLYCAVAEEPVESGGTRPVVRLDVSDARRALVADFPVVSGRLTIGVTSLVAGYVLAELLARFRRAFPAVAVELVEDTHDYLEHLLLNGEIDLALVIVSALHNPDALAAEILDEFAYRAWLPLGHPLAGEETVELDRLAGHPQIVLDMDEIKESAEHFWRGRGLRPSVVFRTRSVEAVRSLVATGLGIAVLPDLVFRPWSLEGHRLEARTIAGDLPRIKAAIAWRRGSTLDGSARRFLDLTLAQRAGTRLR